MAFFKKKKKTAAAVDTPVIQESPVVEETAGEASVKSEPNRQRTASLKIRLTEEEKTYIEEQATAAGMTKTDYIMAAVKGTPIIVIDDVPQLLSELRRQGVNLNQAVRLANQTYSVEGPELIEAANRCADVQAEIMGLVKRWDMVLRKAMSEEEQHGGGENDGV